MMKNYYPVMLDINNKACLVIGGGVVSSRKVISLLENGACVSVLSPDICQEILELHNLAKILWIKDHYKINYLDKFFLVFAATNNSEINKKIYTDAKNKNILVNIVDVPELCDFIMPAVFKQGDLSIAVSTNGKSPTLAKKICEDFSKTFDVNYSVFLNILGELRKKVFENISNQEKRTYFFKKIVYSDYLTRLKHESLEEIKQEIELVYRQSIAQSGQDNEK